MKNFLIYIFAAVLTIFTSCTRGDDPEKLGGNIYVVEGTFLSTTADDVYGSVSGLYHQGVNSFTLDLEWKNLPFSEGNSIVAFALVDEGGNEFKKISYVNNSTDGEFSIVFAGLNSLSKNQQEQLIANKLRLRICTLNDMGVTVEAKLNSGLVK